MRERAAARDPRHAPAARGLVFVALALALAPASRAQDLPGIDSPDTLQVPESTWRRVDVLDDFRLRGDFVRALPNNRDDLRRARSFLRFGAAMFPLPALELGAAFEAALGSDHNNDNRINNDNEPSDDLNLDLAYARWAPAQSVTLEAGRTPLPLRLSALTWDDDLRPLGGSIAARRAWRDYDTFDAVVGGFAVRSLAESWVRLAAAQVGYAYRDGAPAGADVRLAYLWYDRFESLVTDGLSRTNGVATGRFVAEFDLLDVQVAARLNPFGWRSSVHGEWVENLGADTESSAWRAGLVVGDVDARGRIEARYFFHRVERDAVLAAFNSDDWWFHSRFRGHRGGVAVGLGRGVVAGVSGSAERRDDLATWTKRLLLDLRVDF
jgi:hypothetical protein